MIKGEQLDKLVSGYFDRGKQSFEMQLQDGLSTNNHEWATAAYEDGREKYRDDENDEVARHLLPRETTISDILLKSQSSKEERRVRAYSTW